MDNNHSCLDNYKIRLHIVSLLRSYEGCDIFCITSQLNVFSLVHKYK